MPFWAVGNQWYKDGILIAGARSQVYTATDNGSYSVTVTLNGWEGWWSVIRRMTRWICV
jgi:hypothetical protein